MLMHQSVAGVLFPFFWKWWYLQRKVHFSNSWYFLFSTFEYVIITKNSWLESVSSKIKSSVSGRSHDIFGALVQDYSTFSNLNIFSVTLNWLQSQKDSQNFKGRERQEEGIFWWKKRTCNLSPTFSGMDFTFYLSLVDVCSAPTIFSLTSLWPDQALDLHICLGPNSQIPLGEVLKMRSGIRNVVWMTTSETLIKKVLVNEKAYGAQEASVMFSHATI